MPENKLRFNGAERPGDRGENGHLMALSAGEKLEIIRVLSTRADRGENGDLRARSAGEKNEIKGAESRAIEERMKI